VIAAVALALFGVTIAYAAPSSPGTGTHIDGYAAYAGQSTCDPTAKPGVQDLRDLLNAKYGARTAYITRACGEGGTSEHKEGRALDYMLNVNNSADRAVANDVLNWLLATDRYGNRHAMARRLGIMYIIWNRQQWRAYRAGDGWQPYTGANPHTDHIHFSFGWAGARRQSTWWTNVQREGLVVADVTGDGYDDLIGRRGDGVLRHYRNGHGVTPTAPFSPWAVVGTGFGSFVQLLAADVSGDGFADLMSIRPDGTVRYFQHSGNITSPYGNSTLIGTGFGQFTRVLAADVNNDGYADLMGTRTDGTVRYFQNSRNPGGWYGNSTLIGTGFNQFTRLTAGDVNGDGFADLLGSRADGTVRYFQNSRNAAGWYGNSTLVGTGFARFSRMQAADITGDGYTDLIVTTPDGTLRYFVNGRNAVQPYGNAVTIGTGFNMFQ
jgi:hypothetical protein